MEEQPPRPRRPGGQPGNTNAIRHALYARASLTAHTRELLELAPGAGLDDDIDLLRVEIARLVEQREYNPRDLAALMRAVVDAELARQKLGASAAAAMDSAMATVLDDIRTAFSTPETEHA